MKALLIIVFTGFALVAMAQGPGDDNRVTFDSPEPTVKVVTNSHATNTVDRVVFQSPEPQVKQVKNTATGGTTDKPRVEFTSPAPTNVSITKPKDE